MARILSAIWFIILVADGLCYDDITVGDLPDDTAVELEYMIEKYPDVRANCTGHPVARSADFLLYTRNNPIKPIVLDGNTITQINPEKDVIMLIHGWLSTASSSGILKLKEEYLDRYDCNVISVNWTKQSFQPYTKAYCDVPGIARAVTQLLCTMHRQLEIPLSTIHVLGHTIGAQIAGFAGQYAISQCNQQIGRITGLDPAGPIFQSLWIDERLDKSDALFVDVIHTDELNIGSWRNSGHLDFHASCGLLQPGCPSIKDVSNDTLVSDALCSNIRSLEYMAESIASNDFIGISCARCPEICRPDIMSEVYAVMGEDAKKISGRYKFYIGTRDTPPYAEGWDPYPYISEI